MAGRIEKRLHPSGVVRWRATLEVGKDAAGKRVRRRQDFVTKKEAQSCLAQWQVEQRQGTLVDRSDQTVAEMMAYWLETYASTKKMRTEADYRYEIEKHLIPYLGKTRVQALEPQHIVSWHTGLRRAGKSPRAIAHAHLRLQQALDQAMTLGLVPRNVAKAVRPSKGASQDERPTWTADEARSFLEVARLYGSYGPIWRVSLATGLRRGELLGLRWCDVDVNARLLRVRQSATAVSNRMVIGSPKTKKSVRDVAVTNELLSELREHRVHQNERRLALGPAWIDLDLVFCSELGTAIGASNLYREYARIIRLAGVPHITIHDQRHTHASWAIARGVDPKTLSERLGHDGVEITLNRYTHTSQKQHQDAARDLDHVVTQPKEAGHPGEHDAL